MLGVKDKTRFSSIVLALRTLKRRRTVPIDNWKLQCMLMHVPREVVVMVLTGVVMMVVVIEGTYCTTKEAYL